MTNVQRLQRNTAAPKPGILHFGPGAFFRAFVAPFTEDAINAKGGDWGIIAVSLKSRTALDLLGPQQGAYTAIELAPNTRNSRQVGVIADVLVASDDPAAIINLIASEGIKIVTLTITEKGYCFDPATGDLRLEQDEIQQDLAQPTTPQTAIGFLVAGLSERRKNGGSGLSIVSCDNLPSNGKVTAQMILSYAKALDTDLVKWIEQNVSFPSTMVDRITPATTDADIAQLAEHAHVHDPACVVHEPFRQWVIQDDFAAERPAWEAAGAQIVSDVAAHEAMKLRCLNGTHSALAYLGYLSGFETVADATSNQIFVEFCKALWREEIVPTVAVPEGEDLEKYCAALLERYQNPSIQHRLWQIAADGSQKLPQRLLAPLQERLNAGAIPRGLVLCVAAWMHYVRGRDAQGRQIDVRDPLSKEFRAIAEAASDDESYIARMLEIKAVFGTSLAHDKQFRHALMAAYQVLKTEGALKAVGSYTKAQRD